MYVKNNLMYQRCQNWCVFFKNIPEMGVSEVVPSHGNRRYTYLKVNEKGCIEIPDCPEYRNELQIITLKWAGPLKSV